MRSFWAGLFLFFVVTTGALAQVSGTVTSVGYSGFYRPDGWVPVRLSINSTSDKPLEVQIRIHQQDLDKDQAIYTRTVTLAPRQPNQTVWGYFLPQPTDGGLPEAGRTSGPRLGDVLRVHVYDKAGTTLLASLSVPPNTEARDLDSIEARRGTKLVLVVRNRAGVPRDEYQAASGLTEEVRFVDLATDELPDHVLGYSPVDAVLWLDANIADFAGSGAFTALQQWVRRGGNLAIINPSTSGQLVPLANAGMLPMAGWNPATPGVLPTRTTRSLAHLITVVAGDGAAKFSQTTWDYLDAEQNAYQIAESKPLPDSMVDAWITLPATPEQPEAKVPFIVRRSYGSGTVTWVSQNLADSTLHTGPITRPLPASTQPTTGPRVPRVPTNGWPRLWDRVFGWRNQTRTDSENKAVTDREESRQYEREAGMPIDIGAAVAAGVEHSGRSTAYVFLAVLFFVGYWIIAGPGAYLYLGSKKRKSLSWIVFGGSAVVATLLTVLVVKLLLSGGTSIRHVSVVRLTPADPAADGSARFHSQISSRLGLYIPKDGTQRVSVAEPGDGKLAQLAPFAVHRRWTRDDVGFTDTASYVVDMDPILTGKSPSVDFFLRSTLKKVQAEWSGTVAEGITGTAELRPRPRQRRTDLGARVSPIHGVLTNRTGRRLADVHFVYTYGDQDANTTYRTSNDFVLYVPEWKDGESLDLAAAFVSGLSIDKSATPGSGTKLDGYLDPASSDSWSEYLYSDLSPARTGGPFDDRDRGYNRSFILMSLIDRVGPYLRKKDAGDNRPEAVRRGSRDFNVSQLVAAGRLVILAHTDNTTAPIPLDVNGERIAGEGVTFFQIDLPLNRDPLKPKPATKPATQSVTQPATAPTTKPAT